MGLRTRHMLHPHPMHVTLRFRQHATYPRPRPMSRPHPMSVTLRPRHMLHPHVPYPRPRPMSPRPLPMSVTLRPRHLSPPRPMPVTLRFRRHVTYPRPRPMSRAHVPYLRPCPMSPRPRPMSVTLRFRQRATYPRPRPTSNPCPMPVTLRGGNNAMSGEIHGLSLAYLRSRHMPVTLRFRQQAAGSRSVHSRQSPHV